MEPELLIVLHNTFNEWFRYMSILQLLGQMFSFDSLWVTDCSPAGIVSLKDVVEIDCLLGFVQTTSIPNW